jgi:hypothetical protein
MTTIHEHEGSKYLKVINSAIDDSKIHIDVYCVLEAFGVTCPARQHAIKKLLCTGTRGKGDALADLKGALAAINRAVEMEKVRFDKDQEIDQMLNDFNKDDGSKCKQECPGCNCKH